MFNKAPLVNNFFTSGRFTKLFSFMAFASLLFGIKLWLIHTYGNPTPFWDQWDGEAGDLYAPFLEGTLHFQDLFSAHNEHRIFTTRLLSLAELEINGVWNPILQMVVNAALHITVLIFFIILMLRIIGQKYLFPILAFSLILFSMPYAYENTLAGFQAQFYFVLFFSFATLWLMITKPPLSARWWVGLLLGGWAYFSLASGVFAIAAATGVSIVLYVLKLQRNQNQLLAILILIATFILGVLFTPTISGHLPLKAHTPLQFANALYTILSWPLNKHRFFALILNAPAIIFIGYMLWRRPHSTDPKWFIFGILIWAGIQSASIAYGRYEGPLAPRYLDLYAILILTNFICLLSIFNDSRLKDYRFIFAIFSGLVWIAITLVAVVETKQAALAGAQFLYQKGLEQQVNTRNYVATGDMSYLTNKPLFSIPFPNANYLGNMLNKPSIRSILPSNIAPPETKRVGNLDTFIDKLLINNFIFLYSGLLFLMLAIISTLLRHYMSLRHRH